MKALLVIAILLVVCLALFLAGIVVPRRSRKMQAKVDDLAKKGEQRSDDSAGRLGDATRRTLEASRQAADASAIAGRRVNDAARRKRP